MKLLNFIILNFDFLILVESGIPRINQSLFDSDSNFNLINDASDLFIFESFKNDNSNSIQTYPPNPFLNDPLHSFSLHELDYDHTPGISPTDFQISSHLKHSEFISPILESSSTPQREIPTSKRKIPTPKREIPTSKRKIPTAKRKIPTSDINSRTANKRRRKGSKSNQEQIESSTSHSGLLIELPYSERNCPQNWKVFEPEHIGGIIAKKSIDALELQNGNLFFHLPQVGDNSEDLTPLHNKIFRLDISDVKQCQTFFTTYWFERSTIPKNKIKVGRQSRSDRKRLTWEKLVTSSDKSESVKPEFLIYKETALLDFKEEIDRIDRLITHHLNIKIQNTKEQNTIMGTNPEAISALFRQFPRAINIFPLFLLFVDLINTILPAENFDKAGNILREQQKIAGNGYLQLAKYLIGLQTDIEDLKPVPKFEIDMFASLEYLTLFPSSANPGIQFIWKSLHYWMINSRQELLKIAVANKDITRAFQDFFSQLIECWCLSP